jgi:hypothetical protein
MSECRKIQGLLVVQPINRSADEQAQVEAHLATCPACAAQARIYAEQDLLIRSTPSARLTSAQRSQLFSQIQLERRRFTTMNRLSTILGAVAVVAILVGIGLGVKVLIPSERQEDVAGPPETPTTVISPEPMSTSTSKPTATPDIIATSLPEPMPTSTPMPTVTPDVVATIIATNPPDLVESYPSPDGLWRVELVTYACVTVEEMTEAEGNKVEQLKLIRTADNVEMLIDSQVISCGESLGAFGLAGWFWSPNSRYFYYTTAREGVPDGGGGECWERPLIQFDVTSGNVEPLSQMWALSPDGAAVAMWQGEDDLIFWSLDEGETGRTPVLWGLGQGEAERAPDAQVCEIAWSPDSQALVYLLSLEFLSPNKHIVYLDLGTMEQRVLAEIEGYYGVEVTWSTADQIALRGYREGEWKDLTFDLSTGELRPQP